MFEDLAANDERYRIVLFGDLVNAPRIKIDILTGKAFDCLIDHDILAENRKVIIITKSGYSIGFPLKEVSEMKKTGRGVKAITLDKNDVVEYSTVVSPETEIRDFTP